MPMSSIRTILSWSYKELAERVRYFKEDEEGMKKMCWFTEEIIEDERIETAKLMLADGEPIEKIVRYTRLTIEQVQELAKS